MHVPGRSHHGQFGLHLSVFCSTVIFDGRVIVIQRGENGIGLCIIGRILEHRSAEGPFQLPLHDSTDREQGAWALRDAPLIVYALMKFGLRNDPAVEAALAHLVGLLQDNGWPCVVSQEIDFRGPGRKDDPCPFATLAMLKALAEIEGLRNGLACRTGGDALLTLWSESVTRHPYMFFMGTDFRKPKVPLIWYDLVHVLDVLSRLPWLREDPRFLDMLGVLKSKADAQGRFTLESVWTAWKDWEFGQKKEPSRWLTLLAWRIIGRVETASMATKARHHVSD